MPIRFLCSFFVLFFVSGCVSVYSQSGNSEIFLFDLRSTASGVSFEGGKNISKSPGYDNQPSFGNKGDSVLYTSIHNERSPDIFEYMISTGKTKQITKTDESEYTPRSKNLKIISFIREGKGQGMTVWNYNRETKRESKAFPNKEPVAYYDWNSKGGALVWVRYAWRALYLEPAKKISIFVTEHVQPSSPQNIPGTDKFSFIQRQGNDELWVKEFDPSNRAVRPIVRPKDGSIDYCWLPDGTLVTGSGSKLFGFNEGRDKDWVEIADLSKFGLKDITRLAASPDGKRMAVVSNQ